MINGRDELFSITNSMGYHLITNLSIPYNDDLALFSMKMCILFKYESSMVFIICIVLLHNLAFSSRIKV